MVEQPEGLKQLQDKLGKLAVMANEAVQAGDMDALLSSAGEIAALKKVIESTQKAEKMAKQQANSAAIMELLRTVSAAFEEVHKSMDKNYKKLVNLGHEIEVVRFNVDYTTDSKPYCQVGPKTKSRASTGQGGGKSKRTVTLADGSQMDTRAFVDQYADDTERASKTFESWPTALAPKIAKRVGATIS